MRNYDLLLKMFDHNGGDPAKIQHSIKVYELAKMIGEGEELEEKLQHILETAAILHDVGIKPAMEKYGSCEGKLQEQEGPPVARRMLSELGYDEDVTERVCWLIAHHHTYTDVLGMDHRILLEADFLVNLFEEGSDRDTIRTAYDRIFRTETGKKLCKVMFGSGS